MASTSTLTSASALSSKSFISNSDTFSSFSTVLVSTPESFTVSAESSLLLFSISISGFITATSMVVPSFFCLTSSSFAVATTFTLTVASSVTSSTSFPSNSDTFSSLSTVLVSTSESSLLLLLASICVFSVSSTSASGSAPASIVLISFISTDSSDSTRLISTCELLHATSLDSKPSFLLDFSTPTAKDFTAVISLSEACFSDFCSNMLPSDVRVSVSGSVTWLSTGSTSNISSCSISSIDAIVPSSHSIGPQRTHFVCFLPIPIKGISQFEHDASRILHPTMTNLPISPVTTLRISSKSN
mmetsp:Transcript_1598/g.1937  ORF Transcript_1598/g.1937 Transcript_1598/m.1937 type:complete len:301 (+) Transcript_1598:1500-2402(+)